MKAEDDGEYECQSLLLRSKPARLTVFVPPNNPYVENGPVQEVRETTNVTFRCVAEGSRPQAKVRAAKC